MLYYNTSKNILLAWKSSHCTCVWVRKTTAAQTDCLVSSSSACGRFTRAMECGDYQPQPRVCTHGGLGRKRLGFWQHVQHWISSDSHACYDNVWMLMNAISSSPLHRSSFLCENTRRQRWHLAVRLAAAAISLLNDSRKAILVSQKDRRRRRNGSFGFASVWEKQPRFCFVSEAPASILCRGKDRWKLFS